MYITGGIPQSCLGHFKSDFNRETHNLRQDDEFRCRTAQK